MTDDDNRKRKIGGIVKKTISRRILQLPLHTTMIVKASRIRNGSVLLMREAAGKYHCEAPE
jgi:hypothetical protein